MGSVAGVGSTYQFIPKQIHSLMKLISEGKIQDARIPQLRIQQVCRIMYRYGKKHLLEPIDNLRSALFFQL